MGRKRKPDPLREATVVQKRAARQGFDWPTGDPRLWRKLAEELAELRQVRGSRKHAAEELGDLLFMVVNVSRHLRIDASTALHAATAKFSRRYAHVLRRAAGLKRGDARSLARLEQFWQEAKRLERRGRRARVRRVR